MERTCIKKNFVGFPQRVAPLQSIFHKECPDADLDTPVLEFLSALQKNLVSNMMKGASTFAQHRGSREVSKEDVLLYLDITWKLDPLLVTATCAENCYRVTETTDKTDVSLSPEPLPRKKKTKQPSSSKPSSSKVKTNSARKSKSNQESEGINSKYKVKSQSADPDQLKTHPPFLNKHPELKADEQILFSINLPDSLEFSGNIYKPHSDSVCEMSLPPGVVFKKDPPEIKDYIHVEVDEWFKLDEKTHTFKLISLGPDKPAALKSSEAPICKLESNVEERSATCKPSVKVLPCLDKTESKIPTQVHFDPETGILKKTGLKKDNFKRLLTDNISESNKEKSQPKFQLAKQASFEMPTKKGKRAVSGVKMLHPNSRVRELFFKRRKEEIRRYYDVPVKTPREANKRYAIILLRMAGKFY